MSQKIPKCFRNTEKRKDDLLCDNCKHMLFNNVGNPKWKCSINMWFKYDTVSHKCVSFEKIKEEEK